MASVVCIYNDAALDVDPAWLRLSSVRDLDGALAIGEGNDVATAARFAHAAAVFKCKRDALPRPRPLRNDSV